MIEQYKKLDSLSGQISLIKTKGRASSFKEYKKALSKFALLIENLDFDEKPDYEALKKCIIDA